MKTKAKNTTALNTELFDQKIQFLGHLENYLSSGSFTEDERAIFKEKFMNTLSTIDFTPNKYTRKIITEKRK